MTTSWIHFGVLLLAYVGLYFVYRYSKLEPESIGAKKSEILNGLKYGAVVCGIIFVVLLVVYAMNSHVFRDARYHEPILTAFFSALFLEPFKIVLFEEFAFRGILLALILRVFKNKWYAVSVTSLAFGLWHILPSLHFQGTGSHSTAIISSVVFTSLAGFVLAELRLRSKSLAAPILVHWFVNSTAIMLAAFSWR